MAQTLPLGSKDRPLRVAVVGSGPSGFYAAEALLRTPNLSVEIDMFDRLPTPYGLVRGGVAPDHQKIKAVIAVYEKIAQNPAFRFYGHVKLGQDIQAQDLRKHYDQVVYAVGNESDKRLGVPGEDLKGSHAATAFVGWYNSHPDWREEQFDLSVDSAAVIGIGNVAMDVTRVLAEDPDVLAKTDIADYALEALRRSKVRTIYLLGRRGPAQAAFSPAEIQEIAELHSADLVVDPKDMELDPASREALSDPSDKKNVEFLAAHSKKAPAGRGKKVLLRFCASPVELIGEGGRVTAMKIERNALVKDERGGIKARGTGQFETIKVGLVLRSVGYNGIPIPGVPFDQKSGHIPNKDGRVLEAAGGAVVPGAYVVGWAKRGPSGLIGTNRADSVATVKAMVEDAAGKSAAPLPGRDAVPAALSERKVKWVDFQGWKNLDKIELAEGQKKGKIRQKFSRVDEMLAALAPAGAVRG